MSAELPPFEMPEEGDAAAADASDVAMPAGASEGDGGERLTEPAADTTSEQGAEALTPQQQTLIIGAWASVCGNCGDNAMPRTQRHELEDGGGCGVTWKYVTVEDMPAEIAGQIRPDLTYVAPDYSQDGVTAAMEEQNLKIFEDPNL